MEGNSGKRKKSAQSAGTAGSVPKMVKKGKAVKQEGQEEGHKNKVMEVELPPTMNCDSPEESIRELWKEEGEERSSSPSGSSLEMLDPFAIFPVEVWEMILDRLDDSKLAWNLLKAFPQLDKEPSLQKKKRVWLFGLVIPHMIYNRLGSCWIEDKDLRSCRQVCTSWSSAVDTFLSNQPQLKVPDPEVEQAGQFNWNLKAYLDRQMKQPRIHSKGVVLSVGEPHYNKENKLMVSKFLSDSEGHPPTRNPFVSSSLSVNIWPPQFSRGGHEINESERNNMLELHQRFGEHVWFYGFEFHNGLDDFMVRHLAENIVHLPNLRLLRITGNSEINYHVSKENMALLERNLPPLPHLETLLIEVEYFPYQFSEFFVRRFSFQLRKLQMEYSQWLFKDEYFQLFPNLVDLEINNIYPREGDMVMHILTHLESPKLSKLKLSFGDLDEKYVSYLWRIEEDIFKIFKRFKELKSFNFIVAPEHVQDFREKDKLSIWDDTVPSLEFLAIRVSPYLTLDFLHCLPSLRYLELHVDTDPTANRHSKLKYLLNNIRKKLKTGAVYRANVWGILPKLNMISLWLGSNKFNYSRDGFENNKYKAAGGASTSSSTTEEDLAEILFMNQSYPFSESEDDDEDEFDGWGDMSDEFDGEEGEEEENEYDSDGNLIEEEEEVEEEENYEY